MEIKIGGKNEHRFFPEIGNNNELPEAERFSVVLLKRHRMIIQGTSVSADGKFDIIEYTKASIARLDNPPWLNFGSKKRAMEVADIFAVPELEDLATQIFIAVTNLNKTGELEVKN